MLKEKVVKFMFLALLFLYGSSAFLSSFVTNNIYSKSAEDYKQDTQKAVIFDLGKVVLFSDKKKAFKSFQMKEVVSFFISHGMPNEDKLFECLIKLSGKDEASNFPACLRPWFTGACGGNQLCEDVCSQLENSKLTQMQKNFVRSCMQNMRPERMADVHYLDKKAARFICQLLNSVDENGQPIKVIILSNWDRESFELVSQKFSYLFNLIGKENIVISGNVGLMKPDPDIYNYVLNKYQLSPNNCFFVDDSKENVETARNCGIKSVHHKSWLKTPSKLKKLGLKCQAQASKEEVKELALACLL